MSTEQLDVAVIGAGPYGLSVAAHLAEAGIEHRVFGTPMHTWREGMPEGMLLRSEGFASSLSHPSGDLTFENYRVMNNLSFGQWRNQIPIDVFNDYAQWFIVESGVVAEDTRLEETHLSDQGFALNFSNGETVHAMHVVVAVGLTHFAHTPEPLSCLNADRFSHSSRPMKLTEVAGSRIAVVGAGQSALETAALLHEHGAEVDVLARCAALNWHSVPPPLERPIAQRVRAPIAGLGVGWNCWLAEHLPDVFRRLPASRRVAMVDTKFGPAGAWWLRDRVEGRVRVRLGSVVRSAESNNEYVRLTLSGADQPEVLEVDHVVAATGYRVDINRLSFLDHLRDRIERTAASPALNWGFESSVPRLHFVGAPSANTFGPVMRFVVGADFAARRVTRALRRSLNAKGR